MANRLTITQKRWLLSAHIATSVAWLGGALCLLTLGLVAANAKDEATLRAAFTSIDMLDRTLVRPLAVLTVISGLILCLRTQWGLFRFNWVIVKETLTLLSIGAGIAVLGRDPVNPSNLNALLICMAFQILSLSTSVVLSVFKPGKPRNLPAEREAPYSAAPAGRE